MQRELCQANFRPLLEPFDSRICNSQVVSVCGVWSDLSIAYLSPGWLNFAAANGGEPDVSARWPLGENLLSGIEGPLAKFFEQGYRKCLSEERLWVHVYECSSADQFRLFQMTSYPLPRREGLLIVHSLRVERPQHHDQLNSSVHTDYADEQNIVHQCSYCRRVRRREAAVWDWVREYIDAAPPGISHTICESCFGYYAPRLEAGQEFPPLRFLYSEPNALASGGSTPVSRSYSSPVP
ncbi:hypothetical protein Pla8534_70480 [Lignipirellula cremea]|uniref:Uncharacterized protein n=1 Tax=Lignipirellula cremea TaxID=2528010 RepID=A0A518E4X6_9BACT|nr:hypothetical protein Pla8534_70480 [Lignipirellula cremea]